MLKEKFSKHLLSSQKSNDSLSTIDTFLSEKDEALCPLEVSFEEEEVPEFQQLIQSNKIIKINQNSYYVSSLPSESSISYSIDYEDFE